MKTETRVVLYMSVQDGKCASDVVGRRRDSSLRHELGVGPLLLRLQDGLRLPQNGERQGRMPTCWSASKHRSRLGRTSTGLSSFPRMRGEVLGLPCFAGKRRTAFVGWPTTSCSPVSEAEKAELLPSMRRMWCRLPMLLLEELDCASISPQLSPIAPNHSGPPT